MVDNITQAVGTCCEYRVEQLVNITIDELIDRGKRFTIIQSSEEEADNSECEY